MFFSRNGPYHGGSVLVPPVGRLATQRDSKTSHGDREAKRERKSKGRVQSDVLL